MSLEAHIRFVVSFSLWGEGGGVCLISLLVTHMVYR